VSANSSSADIADVIFALETIRIAFLTSYISAVRARINHISIFALGNLSTAVVAKVILAGNENAINKLLYILASAAKGLAATVVALMVLVSILADTIFLITTIVALMVKVLILASTELILTANVAGMIKVGICAVVKNLAAVIARVILIRGRIFANAEVLAATVIAEVILIII
jgi:hypothetical protein